MKTTAWLVVALIAGAVCARAQTDSSADLKKSLEACKAVADSVESGASVDSALTQLRETKWIQSLQLLSAVADFALAAIDVGQRLVAAGRPAKAERFFREAEAPLGEVESAIKRDKHLPGIPSAQEVAAGGISLGEMQARLLAKIEELTLHFVRMEKENQALRRRVQALETAR